MADQVNYYNHFGEQYADSILSCPQPELWTTDYNDKGRVYIEMKERIEKQQELMHKYFDKTIPVLDIGCGFGRQAVLLAKNNFSVVGTDTSDVFIKIAKQLFDKLNYKGTFLCTDIQTEAISDKYRQIILFDVLEHIKPLKRRSFIKKIYDVSNPGAVIIISLPHVKKRISSQLNNNVRRLVTQHFNYFLKNEEHPYPLPQQKNIFKLIDKFFSIEKMIESAETDYYILRRTE